MRWQALLLAALVVLTWGAVSPVQAQDEEPERKECECREWSVRTGPVEWPGFTRLWMGNRARLGIWVDTEPNEETDRIGARVTRVMEDGPADKAGIREGDIITKLGGRSLLEGSEVYDDDESAPAMRLLERARKLERGDTVEVEYRRDGKNQTAQVVAGDFPGVYSGEAVISGDPEGLERRLRVLTGRLEELPRVEFRGPDVTFMGPESFALRLGSSLPGLQLVSLNEDLGEYFGVDDGVLVISAPEDEAIGLKAGDVLLKIDGREVQSPSHAMRILRSYNADEEVTFEIRRKNRNQTVKGKMPERGESRVLEIERERRDN